MSTSTSTGTGTGADTPEISVLMPVRDAADYVDEALRSLAAQTFADFEVVAVDDGSVDGSPALLDDWGRRDGRFRVFHRPAEGLVPALNFGLTRCRGDLLARMDADDLCHPRRFELQRQAFRDDPSLDVVSCLVSHFPRPQVGEGFRIYEEWLNGLTDHEAILRERFIESPLPHPSVMLRRRRLEEAGGYRDVGWPEDYDLWLRMAAAGARFAKVDRALLQWREHGGRLTRTDGRYSVERFLECKACHLASGPLRDAPRVIVWGAGQIGRRLSKHLLRRGVALEGFIDIDPKKIGRTLRSLPVHAPEDLPRLLSGVGRAVTLAAVPSRGARALIRARLHGLGLVEARDFWCVA